MDCSVYHRGGGVDLRLADERIKGRARSDRRRPGESVPSISAWIFPKDRKSPISSCRSWALYPAIYGYTIQVYTTVALGVLIFFLFFGGILYGPTSSTSSITAAPRSSTAARSCGTKALRTLKRKKCRWRLVAVITYSGDKHLVPPKALNFIKDKCRKKRSKTKNPRICGFFFS